MMQRGETGSGTRTPRVLVAMIPLESVTLPEVSPLFDCASRQPSVGSHATRIRVGVFLVGTGVVSRWLPLWRLGWKTRKARVDCHVGTPPGETDAIPAGPVRRRGMCRE